MTRDIYFYQIFIFFYFLLLSPRDDTSLRVSNYIYFITYSCLGSISFCFVHHLRNTLRSWRTVTDIHLPRGVSSFGALLRSHPLSMPPPSRIVFLFPRVIRLARSPGGRSLCCPRRPGRRHTRLSIVLILSYVGVAIVSSLRSSALFAIDCGACI